MGLCALVQVMTRILFALFFHNIRKGHGQKDSKKNVREWGVNVRACRFIWIAARMNGWLWVML
jgi:hypothetical protein